jgi:hypothetical protein
VIGQTSYGIVATLLKVCDQVGIFIHARHPMPDVREASSGGEPYVASSDNSNVISFAHRPSYSYSPVDWRPPEDSS